MKRWWAFAPLAALVLIVVISVVLLTRHGREQPTITTGEMGRPAPVYSLIRLGGGDRVSNVSDAGKPHVINVFASWCTPCRAEHEQLMALKAGGADIVGVAYKDRPSDTTRFLAELGDPYSAVGLDSDGQFGLQLGIAGVPETFVIGADGHIRAVHRGPLTPEVLEAEIYPALKRR